jgi:hypothetical protein
VALTKGESAGGTNNFNPNTGAAGYFQIMPAQIPASAINPATRRKYTPQELANTSPEEQGRIYAMYLQGNPAARNARTFEDYAVAHFLPALLTNSTGYMGGGYVANGVVPQYMPNGQLNPLYSQNAAGMQTRLPNGSMAITRQSAGAYYRRTAESKGVNPDASLLRDEPRDTPQPAPQPVGQAQPAADTSDPRAAVQQVSIPSRLGAWVNDKKSPDNLRLWNAYKATLQSGDVSGAQTLADELRQRPGFPAADLTTYQNNVRQLRQQGAPAPQAQPATNTPRTAPPPAAIATWAAQGNANGVNLRAFESAVRSNNQTRVKQLVASMVKAGASEQALFDYAKSLTGK